MIEGPRGEHGDVISPDAIEATERLIRSWIRHTPILEVDGQDFGLNRCTLYLKLEFLQHSGSFKARGAFANLLGRDVPPAGVVAASGGNHGAAVAYAAMRRNTPAKIFVPNIASPEKMARIKGYGATLVVAGDRYADALAASEEDINRTGALAIHAFDQRETLLGQGTIGFELERQAPNIDTLLVAVGGGGLIGGIAAWYAGRIHVVGVEPAAAPTLTGALAAGGPIDSPAAGIAADSLAPRRIGALVYPIAARHITKVILVEDDAITKAQRELWKIVRLVVEPGGAASFSALLSGAYRTRRGERVGIILSGANTIAVDFDRHS
jgi:threonine dehydratase